MLSIKVSRREVSKIVDRSFPAYKGRKFRLVVADRVHFCDLNWSGGTKNDYALVRLSDGSGGDAELGKPAPWSNPMEGVSVPTSPGFAVVRHSRFCGTDCGLTITLHPADAPMLLPEKIKTYA